jgi:hypothetical protein
MKPLTQVPVEGVLVQLYLTYHVAQVFSPQQHSSTGAQPPDSIPNPLLPLSSFPKPQAAPPRSPLPRRTKRDDRQRSRTRRRRRLLPARVDDDDEYDGDGKKAVLWCAGRRCHRPRRREISSATTPLPRPREISPASPSPPKDLAGPALVMLLTRRRPQVRAPDPSLLLSVTYQPLFPTT